jgi:hypothetical protein
VALSSLKVIDSLRAKLVMEGVLGGDKGPSVCPFPHPGQLGLALWSPSSLSIPHPAITASGSKEASVAGVHMTDFLQQIWCPSIYIACT